MLVLGKSIASGIPLGAYGMTDVARACSSTGRASFAEEVATGGTLFANALSLAAARVTLEEVLTDDAYEHTAALGRRLADGIEAVAVDHDLTGARTGSTTARATRMPRASRERGRGPGHVRPRALQPAAHLHGQPRRLGGDRLGRPGLRHPDDRGDVDRYLEVLDEFLDEVTRSSANSSSA